MSFASPAPMFSVYIVYAIIKKLTTPFNQTEAYKLGIIDANGNILRPRRTLKTQQERNAYTALDTLVFKLKRMLEKVPGGRSKLASYAAALWLIREASEYDKFENNDTLIETEITSFIKNFQLSENDQKWLDLIDLAEGKYHKFQPKLKIEMQELNLRINKFLQED